MTDTESTPSVARIATLNFARKTVLVTGAAGGLGTTIAHSFAAAGAHVLALDLPTAPTAPLLDPIRTPQGVIDLLHADLADLRALRGIVAPVLEEQEGVDVLINNAAIYPSKPFDQYSDTDFEHVQRVNAHSALALAQMAAPYMKKRQYGRIINVASITLSGGWPNLLPYVASKGAVVGLTRALARELGAFGITVNCISPGAFPTAAEKIHPDGAAYTRFVLDHQAIKRRGAPQDIANAMLFLASEHSAFITGQTLNVDGGWIMS